MGYRSGLVRSQGKFQDTGRERSHGKGEMVRNRKGFLGG